MRNFEIHLLESGHDVQLALTAGLLSDLPDGCDRCTVTLTTPFSVYLTEEDISVSLCGDCLTPL
jgi:hypothetical protein